MFQSLTSVVFGHNSAPCNWIWTKIEEIVPTSLRTFSNPPGSSKTSESRSPTRNRDGRDMVKNASLTFGEAAQLQRRCVTHPSTRDIFVKRFEFRFSSGNFFLVFLHKEAGASVSCCILRHGKSAFSCFDADDSDGRLSRKRSSRSTEGPGLDLR